MTEEAGPSGNAFDLLSGVPILTGTPTNIV